MIESRRASSPWTRSLQIQKALALGIATVLAPAANVRADTSSAETSPGENRWLTKNAFYFMTIVNEEAVQQELKITADQAARVAESYAHLKDEMSRLFKEVRAARKKGRRPARVPAKVMLIYADRTAKQLVSVLDSNQLALLKGVYRRNLGPTVFRDSEVLAALQLDPKQQVRVAELFLAANTRDKEITARDESGHSPHSSEVAKQRTAIRNQLMQDVMKELTENQQTKLQELLGPPITIDIRPGSKSAVGGRPKQASRTTRPSVRPTHVD